MDKTLRQKYELKPEYLRSKCDPQEFKFKTTKELGLESVILGQEEAIKRLEDGLKIQAKSHNIFVTGPAGEEREEIIRTVIINYIKNLPPEQYEQKISERKDILSAYNAENPDSPLILEMPAWQGEKFQKTLDRVTDHILHYLEKGMEKYKNRKIAVQKDFQTQGKKLTEGTKNKRNEFLRLNATIYSPRNPRAVEHENKMIELEKEFDDTNKQLLQLEQDANNKLKSIEKEEIVELQKANEDYKKIIKQTIKKYLRKTYEKGEKIKKYFDWLEQEITKDVKSKIEEKLNPQPNPLFVQSSSDFCRLEYKVKLLNELKPEETVKGIPVILEKKPTVSNLFGRVKAPKAQIITSTGAFTDTRKDQHLRLEAGSFLKANGGYLVIHAMKTLRESIVKLIEDLDSGKTNIENVWFSYMDIASEDITPNIKVIINGKNDIYQLLDGAAKNDFINEFDRTFGWKVELNPVADNTQQLRKQFSKKIAHICNEEKIKDVTPDGIAEIIDYSKRLANRQDELKILDSLPIKNLLIEANLEAENNEHITSEHIKKAITEKRARHGLIERKVQEVIDKNILVIKTSGEEIGELNGLSIRIGEEGNMFGKPSRITASKPVRGKGGIKDIHGVVKLSGPFKEMGDNILNMIVKDRYTSPLSRYDIGEKVDYECTLVHEQAYSMIEGDSASSTGLYVALSAIGQFPLDQGIAVTGRLSQKEEVQAIGGVNEKIEGFYITCKERGLTGEQGVMIPKANEKDLMLNEEVVESVKKGEFHIYSISNIQEGTEVLAGVSIDEIDKQVAENLKKFKEKEKDIDK